MACAQGASVVATRAEPADSLGRPQMPAAWRQLRAQVGGLERALRETQAQRDEARATLERYEAAKAARAWQRAADPERVALLADLGHAADCGDVDCERCSSILLRVEAERPRYAAEHEVAELLVVADLLRRGVVELLAAARMQGVGRAARVARAMHALRAIVDGDAAAARRLLDEA